MAEAPSRKAQLKSTNGNEPYNKSSDGDRVTCASNLLNGIAVFSRIQNTYLQPPFQGKMSLSASRPAFGPHIIH
jgi:hypothetical protein